LNFTVALFTPVVWFAVKLAVGAGGVTLMNITDVDKFVAHVLLAFWTIDQLPAPKV
jgi:hypothetical protein